MQAGVKMLMRRHRSQVGVDGHHWKTAPCIYGLCDLGSPLFYIGYTDSVERALHNHLKPSDGHSRRLKEKIRLSRNLRAVVLEWLSDIRQGRVRKYAVIRWLAYHGVRTLNSHRRFDTGVH
jgi:hypothetical protein